MSRSVQSMELFRGAPQLQPTGLTVPSKMLPHLGQKKVIRKITS